MSRRPDVWTAVTALGLILAAVLLVLPLARVLSAGLIGPDGAWDAAPLRAVLSDPVCQAALGRSLLVSSLGALGATLLGAPLAFLTTRLRLPGRRGLHLLAILALISPPFIGAYSWILLLGENGGLRLLGRSLGLELPSIYGPGGIVLVLALQHYPYVYLLTAAGLTTVDPSLEEAAAALGASPWRRLLRVTVPLVSPSLSAGALLAFSLSLANFGVPLLLGRNYPVLATLAYDLFTSEHGTEAGLHRAAAVSLLLIALAALALLAQRWVARRRPPRSSLLRRARPTPVSGWRLGLASALAWGIAAASTLPLAVVVATSFRRARGPVLQSGLSLEGYAHVFARMPRAIWNSLLYASAAALLIAALSVVLGALLARRRDAATRSLDLALVIPYVVPGVVLGIGFVEAFQRPPLTLTGSGLALVLLYVVRRLPYAVRSCAAFLEQLDPRLEEAALVLGASPARAFARVTLPLMAPGALAGATLGWVTSITELSATLVLYVGNTITIPVQIYNYVLDGYLTRAAALSTLLLVATGLALAAFTRLARGRDDEPLLLA